VSETAFSSRVVNPVIRRKRDGRLRMLPPEDAGLPGSQGQDPLVLRAIAQAWKWRRQLEEGEASTLQDIAGKEGVSEGFVGRLIRLAYLAPGGAGGAGCEAATSGDFDQCGDGGGGAVLGEADGAGV
jgi:hypothetical protein